MDIKKPQLVKVEAFAFFFEGVLQHPQPMLRPLADGIPCEGWIRLLTDSFLCGIPYRGGWGWRGAVSGEGAIFGGNTKNARFFTIFAR